LRQRSAAVVDTDDLARQMVQPGQPALLKIQRLFGDDIVGPDGQLRRDELARIVFADAAARQRLEEVLHPRIRERWRAQIAAWRDQGVPLAVVVLPLLFETKAEAEFDATVCVACSAATQQQRLLARGWTAGQIAQRLAAQWPIERKMVRSDCVIWTEGSLEVLAQQLWRIVPAG
jgi:dephospho-CoA kinase